MDQNFLDLIYSKYWSSSVFVTVLMHYSIPYRFVSCNFSNGYDIQNPLSASVIRLIGMVLKGDSEAKLQEQTEISIKLYSESVVYVIYFIVHLLTVYSFIL